MVTAETKLKYKGRSINWLEDKYQYIINAKVRKRDSYNGFFICISCQELKPIKQLNAGHFYAKEFYKAVRFDLDNIHGQCIYCNKYLSANLIEYRKNLIKKIGNERFKQLENLASIKNFKYERNFLIEQIEILKKQIAG